MIMITGSILEIIYEYYLISKSEPLFDEFMKLIKWAIESVMRLIFSRREFLTPPHVTIFLTTVVRKIVAAYALRQQLNSF